MRRPEDVAMPYWLNGFFEGLDLVTLVRCKVSQKSGYQHEGVLGNNAAGIWQLHLQLAGRAATARDGVNPRGQPAVFQTLPEETPQLSSALAAVP